MWVPTRYRQTRELVTRLRAVLASRPEQYLTIARPLLDTVLTLLDSRSPHRCVVCGTGFLARTDGTYCSDACRARAYRRRQAARGKGA